ncbi:hypothetical protein F0562_001673 [Nyssa sinensis]|uniref:Uncharacterized protein n=1 Tax=Nyssa sinensis TaxID=561372 RepID=A0A5J5C7M3_9ASTE|nr:hypothetical protein F0562_001673 [Nyssa sinensis]
MRKFIKGNTSFAEVVKGNHDLIGAISVEGSSNGKVDKYGEPGGIMEHGSELNESEDESSNKDMCEVKDDDVENSKVGVEISSREENDLERGVEGSGMVTDVDYKVDESLVVSRRGTISVGNIEDPERVNRLVDGLANKKSSYVNLNFENLNSNGPVEKVEENGPVILNEKPNSKRPEGMIFHTQVEHNSESQSLCERPNSCLAHIQENQMESKKTSGLRSYPNVGRDVILAWNMKLPNVGVRKAKKKKDV